MGVSRRLRVGTFAVAASLSLVSAVAPASAASETSVGDPNQITIGQPDWVLAEPAPGATKNAAPDEAAAAAQVTCVGKAARILKEHDGRGYYLHFGGIQQCTAAVEQHLSIMLDKWNKTKATWVPTQRAYKSGVGFTIPAYKEPDCSSQTSQRYRLRVYGGAAGGVVANPYPYISDPVTLTCNVPVSL